MKAGFWLEDWRTRRDQEGRWLLEHAAPGYQAVSHTACPYPDSRQGLPMNAGALEQVQRHWSEVCRQVRQTSPARATLQQAFQASLELVCRPLLSDAKEVSGVEAATYKACVGFCQVFCWLVLADEGAGRQSLADFGDGRDFFEWLEREGWLRGSTQVCAGSREQICALYRLFCDGQASPPGLTPVIETVALQGALLLGEGSYSQRMRSEGRAPWIYSLTARPQASPEWARRLLPGRSEALESLLSFEGDREALALELMLTLRTSPRG